MADTLPKKKSRKLKYVLIVFVVILIIAAGAGIAGYSWYSSAIYSPASDSTDTLALKVVAGQTLLDIAPKIQQAGGLKSIEALRIYMRLNPTNLQLQVGGYDVPLNKNVPDLIAELGKGPVQHSVTITIREGQRADEIADVLATAFKDVKRPVFSREEFMAIIESPDNTEFSDKVQTFLNTYKPAGKSLEGFLFPDTYNIGTDASATDVADLLVGTLITRLKQNNLDPSATGRAHSFYEVLIYASIVEKEAFDYPEKQMVADIFIRRVQEGIGLGSDATILYPYKRWSPPPTALELAADTLYNSRLHFGLTPTPIANPGIESIKATLNPTANKYYYFLHGKDSTIYYARTFAEHQQNIANHLL